MRCIREAEIIEDAARAGHNRTKIRAPRCAGDAAWAVAHREAHNVSFILKIWILGSCPGVWAVALVDTWAYLGNCLYIMHECSSHWCLVVLLLKSNGDIPEAPIPVWWGTIIYWISDSCLVITEVHIPFCRPDIVVGVRNGLVVRVRKGWNV